jgi:hypothetical protein
MRLSNAPGIIARQVTRNGFPRIRGLIFLVAHMRAYSSLLSHQIGSNPDVAGYIEAHQKYRGALDIAHLMDKIERAGGHAPAGRFVFDKLLHALELRDAVLQRPDLKLIVLAREPEATIRSIVKLGGGRAADVAPAVGYYVRRLAQLQAILERRRGRALFVEAEALLEDSAAALTGIGEYLGLPVPLTERYKRFPLTGRDKFGDPSPWIQAGTIVRERDPGAIDIIPPARLAAARRAYEQFCREARASAERSLLRPSCLCGLAVEQPRERGVGIAEQTVG